MHVVTGGSIHMMRCTQDEDLKKLLQTSIKTKKKNKKSGKKAGENGAEGA